MIKLFKFSLLLVTAVGISFITGCGEEPEEEYALPTISVTSPDIPAGGLDTQVGETVTFELSVAAEAGLSSITEGSTTVKTFTGTELDASVSYEYLVLEEGTKTLTFTVEDAIAQISTVDITLNVAPGEDLGYLLIDFAGASSASEEKTVVDWDVRTLYTFSVSGSHGSSATAEVVNKQAALSFAVDNADTESSAKTMKIEKVVAEGFDNWGGWAHVIFDLGSFIDQASIEALPQWDNDNTQLLAGSKVIKLDAYYDATVDANFTWDSLSALTDIWNADPSMGYKIDLALASYDPMGIAENGHDGSFYIGYEAYIDMPNTWVTLTFDAADLGRTGNFYGVAEGAPGPDVIDCVKILPSPGYTATDANPLYIRNLRIVDVE